MKVVAREGLDGLTIARVAGELDAAVGAIYRYFPGKEDLLAALQARALDALVGEMQAALGTAALGAARSGPLARVLTVLAPFATLAERDPLRYRLLDSLLSAPAPVHDDERARALEAHLRPALRLLEDALASAARAGALGPGDAALRTRILWSTLHGGGHLRKRDRLERPGLRQRPVERAALAALLVGFGAPRQEVSRALRRWR